MISDVEVIARAVLYEGYLLYPYRASALKNQQRWNFGVLYPPFWAAQQTGSDRSYFQMECVALCSAAAAVDVSLRFLQIVQRQTNGRAGQEAVERRVAHHALPITDLAASAGREKFAFEGDRYIEGQIEISATPLRDNAFRITLRATNISASTAGSRDEALLHSLASAHAVLQIRGGEFISQTDPPEEWRGDVAVCQNAGVWPVLVGESSARDTMLGSPIILYDYPQIAPESKGDLFDATEIDEILSLRILTLTDEEKDEMRRTDERARRLLERLENSPPEDLLELHGTMRGRSPQADAWSSWDTIIATSEGAAGSAAGFQKGHRVRIRPQKRADIFDTLLDGKIALIEAIEEDFEGNVHFAVVLEDDPGRDLGEMRQIGHRFFFSREEIEPVQPLPAERL